MKNTISNEFITFRVPNTVKDKIEHYAEKDWVSTSEICRRGIKHQLQELSDKYDSPNAPKSWSV
jgi:hypothetical protein